MIYSYTDYGHTKAKSLILCSPNLNQSQSQMNIWDVDINKVNRDRYNIDAPECKKKAYMDLDFRTLNGSEI